MQKKRIGELLVERGAITPAQLEAALAAQKRTRQKLGTCLIQQGVLSEAQLAQVLAESLGVEFVDLARITVDWSAIHMLRARFCENHELLPYAIEGKGTPQKKLVVAFSDPLNQPALEEIGFVTGLPVTVKVATHSQVREAILRYYHKVTSQEASAMRPAGLRVEAVEEEPAVVAGVEVVGGTLVEAAVDPALEALIAEKANQALSGKKRPTVGATKDLDFLMGTKPEGDGHEALERRFWALLKILARKGLITREEFSKELDGE